MQTSNVNVNVNVNANANVNPLDVFQIKWGSTTKELKGVNLKPKDEIMEWGLVSLNGDWHGLLWDYRLHVIDIGFEKEIAHTLVTGDASIKEEQNAETFDISQAARKHNCVEQQKSVTIWFHNMLSSSNSKQ